LLPTGTTVAPPEAAPEDVAAPEAEAVAAPETEAVPARCNSPVPTRPSDVTAAIPPPEITASVAVSPLPTILKRVQMAPQSQSYFLVQAVQKH